MNKKTSDDFLRRANALWHKSYDAEVTQFLGDLIDALKPKTAKPPKVLDLTGAPVTTPAERLASYSIKGEKASFKVHRVVTALDETGFIVDSSVGLSVCEHAAKAIMAHITSKFGVTATYDGCDEGVVVEFDHEIPSDRMDDLYHYLKLN